MTVNNLNLKSPPIVEAVIDIECDLPPGREFDSLEEPAKDRFSDRYPIARKLSFQEHRIELKPNEDPSLSSRQTARALQFLQADEKQLVQFRTKGFSFNRLAPYTSLDDYLAEIERTWQIYVEIANPVQIRLVRLRYINRIDLPATEGLVELEHYFKIAPRLPEDETLKFAGFFNQCAATEPDTGNQINIVLTNQPITNAKLPIIFDMTVSSKDGGEPNDWTLISAKIANLRDLKNRVFKNALTDECLKIFR